MGPQSLSIYKSLFDASDDAMLILEKGKIIHYNPACFRILKATKPEQIINSKPSDFSPKYQEDGQTSIEKAEQMLLVCLKKGYNRFDWLHTRFDGEYFPSEVCLTKIEDQGKQLIYAVIRDITDWRNSELARQAAERKLSLIAENIDDVIWIRDLKFRYTYLSPSVQNVKGYTVEEALNLKPTEAVYREDLKKAFLILSEELENEKDPGIKKNRNRRFQMREYKKDGSLIWTEQTMSFIRDQNSEPIGFMGITRDVTEQRRIVDELKSAKTQAEESDNLKSAFLANMSHEIRTPLNAILGFSELLCGFDLDAEEKSQFLSIIKRSSANLLSIISDILDISKLESKQINLKLRPLNIKEFVEGFMNYSDNIEPDVSMGRKVVIKDIPKQFDQEFLIDKTRTEQIITNLLDNAFKFSPTGKVTLGIKQQSNGLMKYHVADTGPGIPIENQAYIFQRFRQAHESLDRQFGGTGLGLAISKGLVELMGGEIGVKSDPGKGAEFWFTCPLIKD